MLTNNHGHYDRNSLTLLPIAVLAGFLVSVCDFYSEGQLGLVGLYVIFLFTIADVVPTSGLILLSILYVILTAVVPFFEYREENNAFLRIAFANVVVIILAACLSKILAGKMNRLKKLTSIVEGTYDAVVIRDGKGVILYWSQGAEKLYGWGTGEVRGKFQDDVLRTVYPETKVATELALETNGEWTGELSQLSKSKDRLIVQSHWQLQRDVDGAILGAIEANRDVTFSVNERTSGRVTPAEHDEFRGAMLAQMTSSIAHELSQPLSASIIGCEASLRWLASNVGNVDEARKAIESAVQSARRAGDVVARLRQVPEREAMTCQKISPNSLLKSGLISNQDLLLRRQIVPELSAEDSLPEIRGNRRLLEKVVADLLAHVAETLPADNALPSLIIRSRLRDTGTIQFELLLEIGERYAVDNFEELYRDPARPDKFSNELIGSTLSVCRYVIESHSWRVDALSSVLHGIAFRIRIPINKDENLETR